LPLFLFYCLLSLCLTGARYWQNIILRHMGRYWWSALLEDRDSLTGLRFTKNSGEHLQISGFRLCLLECWQCSFLYYSSIIRLLHHSRHKLSPSPPILTNPRNIFWYLVLNEYIPLIWGAIALIVTLMVHEFSHAILCKVEGIRVKSMGILVALVPIGGFASPMKKSWWEKKRKLQLWKEALQRGSHIRKTSWTKKLATRSERVRVLTAGVMANFVTAIIALSCSLLCLALFQL